MSRPIHQLILLHHHRHGINAGLFETKAGKINCLPSDKELCRLVLGTEFEDREDEFVEVIPVKQPVQFIKQRPSRGRGRA